MIFNDVAIMLYGKLKPGYKSKKNIMANKQAKKDPSAQQEDRQIG